MSLLLDALKEAEARKRGAAEPAAAAPAFETDGALALAEDVAPQAVARAESFAPMTPADAASTDATPPPATPADALLAARAARAAPTTSAASAAPRGPLASSPAARADDAAAGRSRLAWLIGVVGLLVLLLGGAALYDALANRTVAPAGLPVAAMPPGDVPASTEALDREVTLQPLPAPTPPAMTSAAPTRRTPARAAPAAPATASVTAPPGASAERLTISREPAPLAAAWAALQRGDVEQAEALYRRVLEAEPGQVDADLGLAVIAHARGDDDAARRGYRRVLESVPDHPRAWGGLAELAGDGELGQVESRLRQLLATRAAAPLHFALGNVLARQQRWSDAQLEYFAAASLEPRSADYAFNVAVALERIGKSGAALPWYRRAVAAAADGRAARFDPAVIGARIAELEVAQP